jgi:hypothetical protein
MQVLNLHELFGPWYTWAFWKCLYVHICLHIFFWWGGFNI